MHYLSYTKLIQNEGEEQCPFQIETFVELCTRRQVAPLSQPGLEEIS